MNRRQDALLLESCFAIQVELPHPYPVKHGIDGSRAPRVFLL